MTDVQATELDRVLMQNVAAGARVEMRTEREAVLVTGHRPNHVLHLILTVLTLGVWGLLVWLPVCAFGGEKRRVLRLGDDGRVRWSRY